jgi:anaphase-promoting complex subunit 6
LYFSCPFPQLASAWIGFGNSFAAQDESDQAMAAYRTASRLFQGSHLPLLCIGTEHLRTNNLSLAEQFVSQAATLCPSDPLCYSELGVVCFRQQKYENAANYFRHALGLTQHLPQRLKVAAHTSSS